MAIGEKITAVMEACRFMPKDAENTFQHYKYTTAAGMFAKINTELVNQGLFTQTKLSLVDFRDAQNAKGGNEKHAVVQATITITDPASGEKVEFIGLGSGQDNGDKSIMKANTAALKYAYVGGLCIAMSDDPESDSNFTYQPDPKPQPAKKNGGDFAGKCSACGKSITQKVADYSTKYFGKPLCMDCQPKKNKNGGSSSAEPF